MILTDIAPKHSTQIQFLGVPQSNQPKFRIGDYVKHKFDWGIGYEPMEQVGRITAILAYETEPGNLNSISANYTYVVTSSSHHPHMIGQEDDASEDELELAWHGMDGMDGMDETRKPLS